jgi:hypothetical protein
MPEIVHFETNVPVELILQCEGGITVAGRYRERVMYTVGDNRRIYVAPFVAQRIRDLAIQPGERFQITKRQVKNGQCKTIEWQVERLDACSETDLERDLKQSIEIAKARNPTDPGAPVFEASETAGSISSSTEPELPPFAPDLASHPPQRNGRNGHGPAGGAPAPDRNLPDTQLAHALKTAIAAAVEAERFAKTVDYNIRFTTDDVRSMGITLLIGMQQRQR